MAISSKESTPFIHSVHRAARAIYRALTFFTGISDGTLDVLVGLCAGRGALLQIERKQTLKLLKCLSGSQTHVPILDDETWAAEVGGSVVGEIEGHPSYLKPWAEPNFGVKFLYRRAAKETIPDSTQDPKYSSYSHDGTLYGALLKSQTSTLSLCTAVGIKKEPSEIDLIITTMGSSQLPVALPSKLPRTPRLTPTPSSNTPKEIYSPPATNESARRTTFIINPTSPIPCRPSPVCTDIFVDQNTLRPQVLNNRQGVSSGSPGLLTILFSQEDEWTCNRRAEGKETCLNQPLPEQLAKELACGEQKKAFGGGHRQFLEISTKENNCEDSDDNMGSIEVEQMRLQQSRRLQKAPCPKVDFQRLGGEIP
jgi:hypothetical protein